MTLTGIVPLTNGGTGINASSDANLLATLFAGAGTVSGMIPGADLTNNSVTSAQLSTTGGAGTWSTVYVGLDGRVTGGTLSASSANAITDGNGDTVSVGTSTGIVFTVGSGTLTAGNWTATGLMIGSSKAAVNKLDVYGAQTIGTGYAGVYTAPTNGLIVQGNVGIGTNSPGTNALQVNGTISATNFVGNGSGLTGIGTSAISGIVGTGNGGSGTGTTFTPGSVVYAGTSGIYAQDNANFFWDSTNHRLGIGTTSPSNKLTIQGSSAASPYIFVQNSDFVSGSAGSGFYLGTYTGSGTASSQIQAFSTGNTLGTNLLLNAAGGNVGIGTTGPVGNLDVRAGTDERFDVLAHVDNSSGIALRSFNDANSAYEPMEFEASEYSIMNGYVGIGTTSPQSKLHVQAGEVQVGSSGASCAAAVGGAIRFSGSTLYYCDGTSTWQSVYGSGGSGGSIGGAGSTGYDAIWTSPTAIGTGLLYESGGKVGIGTTGPSSIMHLYGTSPVETLTATSTTGYSQLIFYENNNSMGGINQLGSSFGSNRSGNFELNLEIQQDVLLFGFQRSARQ